MRAVAAAWAGVVTGLFLGAAGCALGDGAAEAGVRRVEVVMTERGDREYVFEPASVAVRPGERVMFVLRNRGRLAHEFEAPELGLEELVVPPGKERRVRWSAPARAGRYEVMCDLPGHRERGMVMTVVVE